MDHPQRDIVLQQLAVPDSLMERYVERLCSAAADLDIYIDPVRARACIEYLLYILQVNEYINLTSIRDVDDAIVLHLLDSLLFSLFVSGPDHKVLDMGTGGGFPGVPLCLATGSSGVLVDAVEKKLRAVDAAAKQVGIQGVLTVHCRLEEYAKQVAGQFDVVVARALAPLPVLIEYATPFLDEQGLLIVSKGVPAPEELDRGDSAANICGLVSYGYEELDLPDGYGRRTLIVYRKVAQPSIKLPRAVGLAKKSPLA